MDCPRCSVKLKEEKIREVRGTITVDQCPSCEGVWLDKGEISPIEDVVEPTFWESRKIPKGIDQLIGLYCPSCQTKELMNKAEHPRDENVILDHCQKCEGIWLDKGEIEAIQQENWLITVSKLLFS